MPEQWTPTLGLLWRMGLEDDDTRARELRAHAYRTGATALDIARWWRARDERIAGEVTHLHTDGGAA